MTSHFTTIDLDTSDVYKVQCCVEQLLQIDLYVSLHRDLIYGIYTVV